MQLLEQLRAAAHARNVIEPGLPCNFEQRHCHRVHDEVHDEVWPMSFNQGDGSQLLLVHRKGAGETPRYRFVSASVVQLAIDHGSHFTT